MVICKSRDQNLRISESMNYGCQDQNPELVKKGPFAQFQVNLIQRLIPH